MHLQKMSRAALERAASQQEEAMNRLRRAIGLIGVALPPLLLGAVLGIGVPMQNSISEFYFTAMRDVFVLTLTGIGVVLITYYGYDRRPGEILSDWGVSTTAGAGALAVALVPTLCDSAAAQAAPSPSLFDRLIASDSLQNTLHFGAAGVFLTALAIMCLRLFPKSDSPAPGRHKTRRNRLYRACGWVILAMVAALLTVKLILGDPFGWDPAWHFTFWVETVAVWAFGLAWLVKGAALSRQLTFLHGPDAPEPGPNSGK
ncbi:MAG: hypothetical protein R3D85_15730 [Paracoccaceae bacterium]